MIKLRKIIFTAGYLLLSAFILTACTNNDRPAATLPTPDHIVIVIEENKHFSDIIGNPSAPYINSLAARGALFSRSFAITRPSQPNYLALFSGDTQGVKDDSCPHTFASENLGSRLLGAKLTFGSFSESMPSIGFIGCKSGLYVRKHNPCVNWQASNIAASVNMTFADFPADFAKLPTASFVIPNIDNDMHDGTIQEGDAWLEKNMEPYVKWAGKNNSLFILTWDEDRGKGDNRIATIFVGPMVKPGVYSLRIDHYDVLRTILQMYGLAPLTKGKTTIPINGIWVR